MPVTLQQLQEEAYERWQQLKKEVYEKEKRRHPAGCYDMWTLISGTLKVSCQGCGFRMRINIQTMKLEYLPIYEALEDYSGIKEPGTIGGQWD